MFKNENLSIPEHHIKKSRFFIAIDFKSRNHLTRPPSLPPSPFHNLPKVQKATPIVSSSSLSPPLPPFLPSTPFSSSALSVRCAPGRGAGAVTLRNGCQFRLQQSLTRSLAHSFLYARFVKHITLLTRPRLSRNTSWPDGRERNGRGDEPLCLAQVETKWRKTG